MKFKINDIVKIVSADKETCTPSTKNKIGQISKIVKISDVPHLPYAIYFETDNTTLNFMEKEIVLHRRIGQQLLFSFME